jgi:transposase
MFLRVQRNGDREYLLLAENHWADGKVRQRVLHRLGRLDQLRASGQIDQLLLSMQRFSDRLAVLGEAARGTTEVTASLRIGGPLVFGRLWEQLGVAEVLAEQLTHRKFDFPVERAIFLTVLHRLMANGRRSDRAAEKWKEDYRIEGVEGLELQHLYRAMGWLGSALPSGQQAWATPFSPRCTKDVIEEELFARRRDLFTDLSLAFFDTTSLYFEGEGGETLGERGHNKDHRPDLKQMVVGMVLSGQGRPVCSEMWPGNTTDVKTLLPVVDRLVHRFGIDKVCVVADRGMISRATVASLEDNPAGLSYILGARLRSDHEVRDTVLSWGGSYHEVHGPREHSKSPSPLKVKDIRFTGEDGRDRRYVVCHNEEQAIKDRLDREAIVKSLEDQLKAGAKSLVGNKGYRKYLACQGEKVFGIDYAKVKEEARFDGKWVLRTNRLDCEAEEIALRYKDLWMVEDIFRTTKSILETRPIFHKCNDTIRGHVFCSFLALTLMKELEDRLAAAGHTLEWADILGDLEAMVQMQLSVGGKGYLVRSPTRGVAGKVFAACRLAVPPMVQEPPA